MSEHEPTAPITRRTPEEDTVHDHETAPLTDLLDEPADVGRGEHATEARPERSEASAARSGLATGLHPVNVGHLVMGIAFLGLACVWALLASGAADAGDTRWLLPIPWLVAGAAGLAATLWRRPAR